VPGKLLLTNDDGIDAPGIRALHDALVPAYDVTVVAPATDQSGVGGARSWWETSLTYDDHELGYAVEGTPADCVALALARLDLGPDLVVSGCNDGPNVGAHILGRSGTVGAVREAAFLGVPGIAVSMYDLARLPPPEEPSAESDFELAGRVARELVDQWLSDGPVGDADYLNVNVPAGDGPDPVWRITEPARRYEVLEVEPDGDNDFEPRGPGDVELRDLFWREFLDLEVPDPVGTDRRAAVDGEVSVTPLSVDRPVPSDRVGEPFPRRGDRPPSTN